MAKRSSEKIQQATSPGTVEEEPIRLDKWLWAARFFRTRSLARAALDGGMVQVGGLRAKASRGLRLGETVQVRKDTVVYEVVVEALTARRGNATAAADLYQETPASLAAREQQAAEARERRILTPHDVEPAGRPSKRDRREIARFTGFRRD